MKVNVGKIITEEIFKEKMKGIKKARDIILFNILWETGARISEVLAIKIKDIDIKDNKIIIQQLKTRTYSEKIVTISPNLMSSIIVFIKNNKSKMLFDIGRKEGWVLAIKYFGKGFSPKQFRHGAAIDMVNKGIPTETIRRQLGHSRIDITQNYLDYDYVTQREHLKKRNL